MKNKSLLIFGGGINQLDLINTVNSMGLNSVVIDPNEFNPGKKISKFFYKVGGDDYDSTKKIALKHNILGLVTTQTEKPLRLMSRLAQDLNLIFLKPDTLERSLSKNLMKECFVKNKIKCARGLVFGKDDIIKNSSLDKLNFPLIIKPSNSHSSQGVFKVNSFFEIKKYKEISMSYSSNSEIIIEEFIKGREFSVESITFNNITSIIQITEKFITPYPNTVEIGHLQPARLSTVEKNIIEKFTKKVINAIGINNSLSHTELFLTKNGPVVGEIGARGGGDFISSYLTESSTGISMNKAMIDIALNRKPNLKKTRNFCSMIKYYQLKIDHKIVKKPNLDILKKFEGFVYCYFLKDESEKIKKIECSSDRPLCLIFEGKNYEKLFHNIEKIEKYMFDNLKFKLC